MFKLKAVASGRRIKSFVKGTLVEWASQSWTHKSWNHFGQNPLEPFGGGIMAQGLIGVIPFHIAIVST